MNIKYISKIVFITLLALIVTNCGYEEDVIEELSISRAFSPVGFTAKVRNQTIVELNWTANENIARYVVEFSADDPTFSTIFRSIEVTADELPVQVQLEGLTEYSIRVKAISANGLEDSKWATGTATTLSEQLMLPVQPYDIEYNQALLRWEPGINVTQIVLQPGDVTYDITEQEKSDGMATITGLNGETVYDVQLLNNDKPRGFATITTEVDPASGTVVSPTDDLIQTINNAASGAILLLEEGDYSAQVSQISLDKSITIRGLLSYAKPLLGIYFEVTTGATDIKLIDLDLDGANLVSDVVSYNGVDNYNSLLISGCNIHDFTRSFVRGNTTDAILQTLTVENSILTNILTGGGDFIDFRNSDVLNVNVTTSTFNNCAPGRDFFRLDDAGTSTQSGFTCNILLESCTLYACSNSSSRRIMYVRFQTNEITVRNTLITDTDSEGYSDQSRTDANPTFSNNNYFNASGFFNSSQVVYDSSTNFTELDPGFVDVISGDFTITNQTLIDNAVGDPRWSP